VWSEAQLKQVADESGTIKRISCASKLLMSPARLKEAAERGFHCAIDKKK
jgi:hypothetical protein